MTFPPEVTITGSWITADEQTATGTVVITPVSVATGGSYIVVAAPIVVELVAGAISHPVVNNTDLPALQYQIIERIDGAPADSYVVTPTGSTLDLSTAPRSAAATAAMFVLASTVGRAGGVASLDGTGKVPAAQIPGGSGGGVTITSPDATITVGGTSTAPTVDVAAITQAQVTGLPGALSATTAAITAETARAEAAEAALYTKPGGGIPATDLAGAVQTELGLAGSAVQSVTAADATAVVGGTGTAPTVRVGTISETQVTGLTSDLAGKVPVTRTVTGGTGLTGGGALSGDVSLAVAYGSAADTAAQGNDSRLGLAASAVQSVTAANATITVAGTGTAPTVAVGAISEAQVTGLSADLAARLVAASNLADLTNAGTARTNLELGTAATQASTAFDAAGSATTAAAARQALYTTTATQTGTYTASTWQLVPCNASGGSFTVTLPTGASAGAQVAVKLLATAGTNTVTVAAGGSDVINQAGTVSAVLALTGESFEFTSNGAGVWFVAGGQKGLSSLDIRYGITFNVLNYGAKRNYATSATGAMTASAAVLTDTNAAFTAANVGQYITVVGAGAAGVDLSTTIASVASGTSVTLTVAASSTVSGATYAYGTSDTAAVQAAITAAGAVGGTVFFPPGGYVLGTAVVPANNISMVGAGIGNTVLWPFGTAAAVQLQASSGAPLTNFTMAHLAIDGARQAGAYNVATKGIFTQYCAHLTLDDLVVQNCVATGIGTDFLQAGSVIHNCRAVNNGRLNHAGVSGGGGNGIGIGTGGYTVEDWAVSDCYASTNGRYGIMLECQFPSLAAMPTGMRISNCYSASNFGHGYGDAGGSGTIWSNCVAASNAFDGYSIDNGTVGATAMPSGGSVYVGCVATANARYGFSYQPTANNTQSVAGAGNHLYVGCKSFGNTSLGFNINSAASHPVSGMTYMSCESYGNGASGWQVQGASNDIKLTGCKANANGQVSSTSKNGVTLGANITGLQINGCRFYDDGSPVKQAYGIQLSTAVTVTTAHLFGNDLRGNLTGAILVSGTWSGAVIYDNAGYLAVGNIWTPASSGFIAATGDGAMMPSQSAITAGRPFFMPVLVDQALTANGLVTAYVSMAQNITITNTFLGVYATTGNGVAGGALLGQTADLSASYLTVGGAYINAPLVAPITGLAAGQLIYLAFLMNYVIGTAPAGTAPQNICTRLFGTNMTNNLTGLVSRLYTNSSGSTMTTLPATVPTLSVSGTNSVVWIGLTQ